MNSSPKITSATRPIFFSANPVAKPASAPKLICPRYGAKALNAPSTAPPVLAGGVVVGLALWASSELVIGMAALYPSSLERQLIFILETQSCLFTTALCVFAI